MRLPVTVLFTVLSFVFFPAGCFFMSYRWPFYYQLAWFGLIVTLASLICFAWEVAASRSKDKGKWVWMTLYCMVPFICYYVGRNFSEVLCFAFMVMVVFLADVIHFAFVRRKYAPKMREIDKITFDSI